MKCTITVGCSLDGAVKLNHGLTDIAVNWSGEKRYYESEMGRSERRSLCLRFFLISSYYWLTFPIFPIFPFSYFFKNLFFTFLLFHFFTLSRRTASREENGGVRILLYQRYCSRHSRAVKIPSPCAVYWHRYPPWWRGGRGVLHYR